MSDKCSGAKMYLLCILIFKVLTCSLGLAQVALDGTLGPSGVLQGPNYAVTHDLGQQSGSNLFHSFSSFNLTLMESATFTGPASIENIISRVTGGGTSTIDGLIRSDISGANLYFINPGGIVFGPHAVLDISGSFHATTSDYLKLGDTGRFDASTPENSVLTTAAPSAFGFLSDNHAPIAVEGSGSWYIEGIIVPGLKAFSVPEGKTLSLIGGDIHISSGLFIDGTDVESRIIAPGGRIDIASVSSAGEAVPTETGLDIESFAGLGNITISGGSYADVSGQGAGRIFIRGGRFVIDSSNIPPVSQYLSGLYAESLGNGEGGTIEIGVNSFTIANGAQVMSSTSGTGKGADIKIHADETLSASGSSGGAFSTVISLAAGAGDAGSVEIISSDTLSITEGAQVLGVTSGEGRGADINVTADKIDLTAGGRIRSLTAGSGNAGNVTLFAEESVAVSGFSPGTELFSEISSSSAGPGDAGALSVTSGHMTVKNASVASVTSGSGNAGSLTLNVATLELTNEAFVSTTTLGDGIGGDILVEASDSVIISGRNTTISSNALGSADSGTILVSAPDVVIGSSGNIRADSLGSGSAGAISVNAERLVLTGGGGMSTSTGGDGNGGTMSVQATQSVSISGVDERGLRSGLFSSTIGSGNGGNISVKVPYLTLHDNGVVRAETLEGTGNAGMIALDVHHMNLSGSSEISTKSTGTGMGGEVSIQFGNRIKLRDSSISAETADADGGNIHLQGNYMLEMINSKITAEAKGGTGNGGNIAIDPEYVILDSSDIIANADRGDGGNISIVADHFIATPDSMVSASSRLGIDGNVVIDSPAVEIIENLTALPSSFLGADDLSPVQCATREEELSSFVINGRSGLPPGPDSLLTSP